MDLNDISNNTVEDPGIQHQKEIQKIRDFSKDIVKIDTKGDDDELDFKLDDTQFYIPLRISNFDDSKMLDKFIKSCERMIRSSPEYSNWVKYVTDTLGHTFCSFTFEKMGECKIDVHHHPINMFQICKAVVSKFIQSESKFCTFDIAREVIKLHYSNYVGYIPILSNLHEKYHAGFLNIPMEKVFGDYQKLLISLPFSDEDMLQITSLTSIRMKDCESEIGWGAGKYPGLQSDTKEDPNKPRIGMSFADNGDITNTIKSVDISGTNIEVL